MSPPPRLPWSAACGWRGRREPAGPSQGRTPERWRRDGSPMSTDERQIDLSLISHTNVGKTTLARTLLGRDVGEVRDAPHVTADADAVSADRDAGRRRRCACGTRPASATARASRNGSRSRAIRSAGSCRRCGTAAATARSGSSQQAVRNVREQADVVLYLVNAAEAPGRRRLSRRRRCDVLEWIGKPVVVLLNQTGRPRPRGDRAGRRGALARACSRGTRIVRDVLTLDAFARCWVQEIALLRAVAARCPKRSAARVRAARSGMARAPHGAVRRGDGRARRADRARGLRPRGAADAGVRAAAPRARARARHSERGRGDAKERAMRGSPSGSTATCARRIDRLIAIHGLEGRAARRGARSAWPAISRSTRRVTKARPR